MNEQQKTEIADVLNRLPFVRWDRFVEIDRGVLVDQVRAYGWIDRGDGRSDFVVADFDLSDPIMVGFVTSSDRHSEEIGELVYGVRVEGHVPCQRVESVFGDLVHSKVVL